MDPAAYKRACDLFLAAVALPEHERRAHIEAAEDVDDEVRAIARMLLESDSDSVPLTGRPLEKAAALMARESPDDQLTDGRPVGPGTALGSFTIVRELGTGGMGTVWEAVDDSLNRRVALKVLATHLHGDQTAHLERFRREAMAGGRLQHAGIVAVHANGEAAGVHFIVQALVEGGRTLADEIADARDCPNLPPEYERRIVELFATVADALQYAHDEGVVHRDIKPSNILIDGSGRPLVADFGLAHVSDALELSRTGDFAGTPFYMSPEQAMSRRIGIDHRTDVFSLGATLYEALTLVRPFHGSTSQEVLERILLEEPVDPQTLRSRVDRDLAVICSKCIEKRRDDRYDNMWELRDDLRRFLANEPIHARPPSLFQRVRKFARRHPTRSALVAVNALWIVGVTLFSLKEYLRAEAHASEVLAATREVHHLTLAEQLEQFRAETHDLWPATPAMLPAYDAWLTRADVFLAELPALERARDAVDLVLAAPPTSGGDERDVEEIRWRHGELLELIAALHALADPVNGLIHGDSREFGWGIERRREFAASIAERTTTGAQAREEWRLAADQLAESGRYGDLALAPQLGLLPIGRDPHSGLLEFWHVQTGDRPERGADGRLAMTPSSGLALVLVPGGEFTMGVQSDDPNRQAFDPYAKPDEGPPHRVELSPYFISKYELTQGQWERFAAWNPSIFPPGHRQGDVVVTHLHPVEMVSWNRAKLVTERMGLALPTEAQWEHAARGGTDTAWWTGPDPASVQALGAANLKGDDDGYTIHAPVDAFEPNPFGLHNVYGNVWEWTLDQFSDEYDATGVQLDPVNVVAGQRLTAIRGGSFHYDATVARSSYRRNAGPTLEDGSVAVRPARALDPAPVDTD